MHINQESFAIPNESVGIAEVGFAFANGLDLGAAESHTGLEFFQQKVVVGGDAIVSGVTLSTGHRISGFGRFFRPGYLFRSNDVAGLAGHWETSLKSHPSIEMEHD